MFVEFLFTERTLIENIFAVNFATMPDDFLLGDKHFSAFFACVRFVRYMRSPMMRQCTVLHKRFATFVTSERAYARMDSHVLAHVCFVGKGTTTVGTNVRTFAGVRSHVSRQHAPLIEHFAAVFALESEPSLVGIQSGRFGQVFLFVHFARGQQSEIFGAQRTFVPKTFVQFVMFAEGTARLKAPFAQGARERTIVGVSQHVSDQNFRILKLTMAHLTRYRFTFVNVTNVNVQ